MSQPRTFALHEVAPGIFTGRKPGRQHSFDALRAQGVRTILNLEMLPWDVWPEHRQARRNGFQFRDVPILASPLPPSEKRVKEALLILNDPSLRPIFVHCFLGEDRTAFIIGLYRVYFLDWAPPTAWQEMLRAGFHVRFGLRGFARYFWHHTTIPDWVNQARSPPEDKTP
ncbi:MAG TPA: hypothetical protein VJA21_26680 [Verrucomicrobiae bacterium]